MDLFAKEPNRGSESGKTLLVAPGLTASFKTLLVARCIATSGKDATSSSVSPSLPDHRVQIGQKNALPNSLELRLGHCSQSGASSLEPR